MNKVIVVVILLAFLLGCSTNKKDNTSNKNSGTAASNVLAKTIAKTGKLWGDEAAFQEGAKGYVVIYAPTLTDDYVFDMELNNAGLYTYFEGHEKSPKVETIVVAKDDKTVFDKFIRMTKEKHPAIFRELTFVHDAKGQLLHDLALDAAHLDHGGIAVTYDADGKKLFQEIDYKCQGEKLQRMYQHFYPRKLKLPKNNYQLTIGQKAPSNLTKHFANYVGKKNVLMTFYPAPLSHSCSIQMETLGGFGLKNMETKNLKVIAASIGSSEQVAAWELHQPIQGLEMLADTTGKISNDFNSILTDEHGVTYSDRTVFLIDKKGVIRYINQDYDVGADLDVLEKEIEKL